MNNEIIIRLFEEKDVDQTYEMIQQALKTYAIERVYDAEAMDLWREYYTKKYLLGYAKIKHFYVATLNEKIVGSAAVCWENKMAYVSAVYIDPTVQGKGIGKKLMDVIENDDISQSAGKIYMTAALSACKFYQKLGYHFNGDVPEIRVEDGTEFVYLEKEL